MQLPLALQSSPGCGSVPQSTVLLKPPLEVVAPLALPAELFPPELLPPAAEAPATLGSSDSPPHEAMRPLIKSTTEP